MFYNFVLLPLVTEMENIMKKNKLFALLMIIPLAFSLFSCEKEAKLPEWALQYEFIDAEYVKPSQQGWSILLDYYGDGVVTLAAPTDAYEFELSAAKGEFYLKSADQKYSREITIKGSGYAYWQFFPEGSETMPQKTHIEIYIKKDGQYVGYAVAEVAKAEDRSIYKATILACKETSVKTASDKGLTKDKLKSLIDLTVENG